MTKAAARWESRWIWEQRLEQPIQEGNRKEVTGHLGRNGLESSGLVCGATKQATLLERAGFSEGVAACSNIQRHQIV